LEKNSKERGTFPDYAKIRLSGLFFSLFLTATLGVSSLVKYPLPGGMRGKVEGKGKKGK
jgi:hypothetical protein